MSKKNVLELRKTEEIKLPLLILIRHGQTDFNLQKRFQGQMDVPLNELGWDQAKRSADKVLSVIERLPKTTIDTCRVIASDLARASETARIIHEAVYVLSGQPEYKGRFGQLLGLQRTKLFREQNVGELQGKTLDEFHAHFGEAAVQYEKDILANPYHTRPPGKSAESKHDVAARLAKFLQEVLVPSVKENKSELHIWCGHGWSMNILLEVMSVFMGPPKCYVGNGDVLLIGCSPESEPRSELAKNLSMTHRWNMLEHIAVGEKIEGLSFIRKKAG